MFTTPAKRRKPAPKSLITNVAALLGAAALVSIAQAKAPPAYQVGLTWRAFHDSSASSRDYLAREQVRAVVWYPSKTKTAGGFRERPFQFGGSEPTFTAGVAIPDGERLEAEAAWAKDRTRRPLVVMSHGSGGTALQYGWLATELVRRGYVVIAVDHPGASGGERATDYGGLAWWDRPDDIRAALAGALADPVIGPHIDRRRIAMIGYSLGGATGLQLAGATVDLQKLEPPVRGKVLFQDFMTLVNSKPRPDPDIAAYALIAPALLPALDLAPLSAAPRPMLLIAGDADQTVKPLDNAASIARAVPRARLEMLSGVEHNDFLALCTDAGRARYAALCKEPNAVRSATHARTARVIVEFLDVALKN